jgi:hypothetical protein
MKEGTTALALSVDRSNIYRISRHLLTEMIHFDGGDL